LSAVLVVKDYGTEKLASTCVKKKRAQFDSLRVISIVMPAIL